MHYKNYIFVGIQLVLFLAFIFEIETLKFNRMGLLQPVFLVLSGLGFLFILLALLQLNTNLSPFPKPKDNATLITSGVYKYVRHPIYSGILIALFFLALYLSSPFKIFIVLLLVLLFWYKSKYEEEQLCLKYPDYSKYRQHTGRFLPKLIR